MTTTVLEHDLTLADGSVLHVHDTREGDLAVLWHHGTPNVGSPPAPLFEQGRALGVRWVSWDRPGYGTSTPRPGRSVASAAAYAEQVADALGVGSFATMGHSGGGPHALACAALLPERVDAVVAVSTLAPWDAEGLAYLDAMAASGVSTLRAAAAGREARAAYEAEHGDDYDPEFTVSDLACLDGEWGWFGSVVGPGVASGPDPAIDDDVAYVSDWGFDPASLRTPTMLLHGGRDRIAPLAHARWLAGRIPGAVLVERPDDGHLSAMLGAPDALSWLAARISAR